MKSKQRKPMGISPVERAVIANEWNKVALGAQLKALLIDDSDGMVQVAGRVFYVVLGACLAEEADENDPAIEVLSDAANAMYDQKGDPTIEAARRARIVAGLEVCEFLIDVLDRKSITDAACNLYVKLRTGHVNWSDYLTLLGRSAAA